MGNTSGQGREFSEELEREHSFFQETGKKVWGIGTGDLWLLQKAGHQETKKTQGASDRGLPFVPEADPD